MGAGSKYQKIWNPPVEKTQLFWNPSFATTQTHQELWGSTYSDWQNPNLLGMVSKPDLNPNFATRTHYYFKGFINIKFELLWINEKHIFLLCFDEILNDIGIIWPSIQLFSKGEMHFLSFYVNRYLFSTHGSAPAK